MPPNGWRCSPPVSRRPPQRPRQPGRRVPSDSRVRPWTPGTAQVGESGEGRGCPNFPSSSAARRPFPRPRLPDVPAAEGHPGATHMAMLLPLGAPPGNSRIPIGNGRVGPEAPRLKAEGPGARTVRRRSPGRRGALPAEGPHGARRPCAPAPAVPETVRGGATQARRLSRLQPVRGARCGETPRGRARAATLSCRGRPPPPGAARRGGGAAGPGAPEPRALSRHLAGGMCRPGSQEPGGGAATLFPPRACARLPRSARQPWGVGPARRPLSCGLPGLLLRVQ